MTQRRIRSAHRRGWPAAQSTLATALAAALGFGSLSLPAEAAKKKVAQANTAAPTSGRAFASREPVTLNFVNADIEAVTRAMANILGKSILVDPRVKGQMTLYSEQPLSPREAFLTYLATLRGLGYAVVDVSGLLKVVPEADAKLQTSSVSVDAVTKSGDQIVTQVFVLQHENANNLVAVLRPLISPNNTINANPGNNSLVITDYADNLKRLGKIISAMDTPAATDVEVIPLKYAVASDLVQMVQRFADTSAAAGQAAAAGGTGATQVLADSRTNSLMVRAPNSARLAVIRNVIDKLDRPTGGNAAGGNIYVVYLKNADAAKLATVLRAAYSASGSGGGNSGLGGAGSLGGGVTGGTSSPSPTNTSLGGGGANSGMSSQATTPVTASAAPSTGGFIQADPATNSLIITAPEPVYRQLRAVIEQLDARRAQVYVESMIVKMDATQAAEFGFQWQGLLGHQGDKYGLAAGTNFNNGSGANIINLTAATATGSPSSNLSLGAGLNIGLINKIGGIYTLGALARFLESNTGANILSTPNLVTLDNEEAKIVIGQNVPFVTGTYATTNTSASNVNPFQTVERKDVGLTLRVKPQIGENGTVRMVIYQENSSVVAGTGSASNGPTTDKSSIETTVVVDDGQIMVLGGLLKDDYGDGEDRVPGLSRIPLIGNLFRSENRKRTKTNLLVFLRPIVMRTQADANQLTMDRYDAIRAQQQGNQPKPSVVIPINESPVLPDIKRGAPVPAPAGTTQTPTPAQPR